MPRGRPRDFDTEQALRQVTAAFWTRGYGGTSIADLEQGTGLGRTSLYAAFGDKQAMFARALGHYWQARMARTRAVLDAAPTARDGIAALLGKVVANLSDPTQPPGCLRVNSALEAGCLDEDARTALRTMRAELEAAVLACLCENDERRGSGDEAAIARFVVSTINGLAVSARMGASRAELQSTVEVALMAIATA